MYSCTSRSGPSNRAALPAAAKSRENWARRSALCLASAVPRSATRRAASSPASSASTATLRDVEERSCFMKEASCAPLSRPLSDAVAGRRPRTESPATSEPDTATQRRAESESAHTHSAGPGSTTPARSPADPPPPLPAVAAADGASLTIE